MSVGIGGVLLGIAVTTLAAQNNRLAELDRAHEQFMTATRGQNTAAWTNAVTDDIVIVPSNGRSLNKAQRIEQIKKGEGIGAAADGLKALQTRKDYRVRMYDDTAIVTWINPPTTTGDNPLPNGSQYVRVFIRQGDSWRVAHTQQTPIR